MSEIIPLKTGTDEHARAETDRKQRLFAWADLVLQQLGFADMVAQADTVDDLRKVTFNADTIEVALAIRDALHPATGKREEYFVGLSDAGLKRLLKTRFVELKKEREQALRGGPSSRRATRDWSDDLVLDDAGGVRPLLANLILFLREHPKWKGVLAYDEFNARVVIRKRLPWGDETLDATWTDHHESLTRTWFQREDIAAQHGDVGRAVQAAARANVFHPVRDFFDALIWDGTTRLDTWLPTYLHAEDTEYARAVGPRFLISAVARIYEPGCQVDTMPIFEGPQGKLKSTALRTLAVRDEWFSDRLSHVGSKDAILEMAGVLIFELSELDALTRTSSSSSKSFLTRRHDRFRPPYGKHPITQRRQCVFAGTINPPAGGYLKDPTSARRFWPVACRGMIDREGLERARNQIWAEAVHRYKAGAAWWLETPELEALATAEQALRFKEDAWKGRILKWLGKRQDVSIAEVLEHALKIAPRDQTHSAEIRVATILTQLGFTKYRARKGNERENRYQRRGEPDER
jgi:predicted P-loop ATPase